MRDIKTIVEEFFSNTGAGLTVSRQQVVERVLSMVYDRTKSFYQEGQYFTVEDDLTVTMIGNSDNFGRFSASLIVPDGQNELGIKINDYNGDLNISGKDLITLRGVPEYCNKFTIRDSNIDKIDYFPVCREKIQLHNLSNLSDLGVITSINKKGVEVLDIYNCDISSVDLSMMSSTSDIIITKCKNLKKISKSCNSCNHFNIKDCPSLSNLNNIPKIIFKSLSIRDCLSIVSLKGCPVSINRFCLYNVGITSLEYSPENADEVYIEYCKKLKSLKGLLITNCTKLSLCGCSNLKSIDTTINVKDFLAKGISKNLVFKPGELNISGTFDGTESLRWVYSWSGGLGARKYKGYSKEEIEELTGASNVIL